MNETNNQSIKAMSYNVLDIAKKIIARTDEDRGDTISNLKLQKMLYYLQGYWLAVFGSPLFDDEIEAWMYGPVVPSVYDEYHRFGANSIPASDGADLHLESEEEEILFSDVYDIYNQFSATALIDKTHSEYPWRTTETGKGNVITKEKMRAFFLTQVEGN